MSVSKETPPANFEPQEEEETIGRPSYMTMEDVDALRNSQIPKDHPTLFE